MKKVVINDWVEQFNYTGIVLDISLVVNKAHVHNLINSMKKSYLNKLWRLEYAINSNRLIYIENCDLQDIELDDLNYMDIKSFRKLDVDDTWVNGIRKITFFYYEEED